MLTLQSGDSSLQLLPDAGGAIQAWSCGPVPLMCPVRGMGCFPLVPYANRIAHGRFHWDGRDHRLPLNFGNHPHSIHGIGWQRRWIVESSRDDRALLTLAHQGTEGWPFRFAAEQSFVLMPRSLRIELRMTNRHDRAAPAGLGLHPFFPRPSDASLRFNATSVWLNDPTALPERCVPVPDAWDHAADRAVGDEPLDNCFAGWDGAAHLQLGAASMTIAASDVLRHLQVYTPPGEAFFCVEPVTHRPDAINGEGMAVLRPGESLAGSVTFHMTKAS